ncbi:MAG: hypothetical protein GX225_07750 [Clostridiales bacterium]|nr:hypothetical protein [Clostridiales bacterium]
MSKNFKRLNSAILTMVMILTLFSATVVQAANIDISSQNESMVARTNLTFLEGISGDNHLVYTYQENGQQYKVIENADSDFMNVYSTIYVMDSDGSYVETKS